MRLRNLLGFAVLVVLVGAPAAVFAQFNQAPLISTSLGGIISGTNVYGQNVSGTVGTFGSIGSGLINATGISVTTNQTSVTSLYASGNVGIGTTAPSTTLALGNAKALGFNSTTGYNSGSLGADIFKWTDNSLFIDNFDGAVIFRRASYLPSMLIDSSGNVGIGTTSPSTFLEVGAGSTNGDDAYTAFFNQPVDGLFGTIIRRGGVNNPQELIFGVNQSGLYSTIQASQGHINVDSLALQPAGGNVGIGTTSPTTKLEVVAGADTWAANFYGISTSNVVRIGTLSGVATIGANNNAGNVWADLSVNPGGNTYFGVISGNVGIGTAAPSYKLHVNGSVAGVGAYNALSDRRFKKNIHPANYGLAVVEKLRPVTFDWISAPSPQLRSRQLGLIAQEVQPLVPEAVNVADDPSHTMSIAYGTLTPVLIKAVQELKADNDNLRGEFEAYKRTHP